MMESTEYPPYGHPVGHESSSRSERSRDDRGYDRDYRGSHRGDPRDSRGDYRRDPRDLDRYRERRDFDSRDRYRDSRDYRDHHRGGSERRHYDSRDRDRDYRRSSRRSRSPEIRRRPRSPSPIPENVVPLHLRPKKLNNWDAPPPGYENIPVAEAKASGHFPLPCHLLRGNGLPITSHFAQFSEFFRPGVSQAVAGPGGAEADRQAKRLYVQGIGAGVTDDELVAFFNRKYVEMKLEKAPGNPVVSVHHNAEKGFAFVEFRDAEEATRGLEMDNCAFQGSILRVRRPKDYVSEMADASAYMSMLGESPNKIFVGGLPSYLTEEQVRELLTSFGELNSFTLISDPATGQSKGFGFCEYKNAEVTDLACQGLHGMELGEKKLVVQRSNVGKGAHTIPVGPVFQPIEILARTGPPIPTCVLLLLNMASAGEIQDDNDYEDFITDIKEECSKYGELLNVVVPRTAKDEPPKAVEKVFVQYGSKDEAQAAHKDLAGRRYAERVVVTSYYDEEKFNNGEY